MSEIKVVDNVFAFLDRAAALRSRMQEERFSQEMHSNCVELGMSSPLEHLFWIASHVLCESEYQTVNPDPICMRDKDGKLQTELAFGIYITPQHKVEQYTVDFLIEQVGIGPDEHLGPVVVELDGHAFHDKDKRQRSYEKARDRFLVKKGYRVLHFTGSDVCADPFKVAYEALELVGCFVGSYRAGYDKSDPLGIGE
jgi:very-short-patch-repair endonuclease